MHKRMLRTDRGYEQGRRWNIAAGIAQREDESESERERERENKAGQRKEGSMSKNVTEMPDSARVCVYACVRAPKRMIEVTRGRY